jgi:mono/diheme cytochrome c family protein
MDGGLKDGGLNDGGLNDGVIDSGSFVCPTMPVPGSCAPPVDIRCPYAKLSQTGCIDPIPFSDSKIPIKMASVVVPYEVNSPLWSDGALKTRGMRLPSTGSKIHVKDCATHPMECCVLDPATLKDCLPPADDGKWVFPAGTVMVKNFMFPDASRPSGYKLVETRLFIHLDHFEKVQGVKTDWVGYGYRWDDAQTDATIIGSLVDGSDIGNSAVFHVTATMGAATQPITWNYPSRLDCITCHMPTTPSGGNTLGPETIQMNRIATGDTMNQIDRLAALGMFETAPGKPYKAALVPPYPGQSGSPPAAMLEQRARSYLHANCSFCHRPDGKWNGFDVRYDVPLKSTAICNGMPGKGDLGVTGALLLTPAKPASSVMLLRMKAPPGNAITGGTGRMPAIASDVVDTQATDLISQWISSISACPM